LQTADNVHLDVLNFAETDQQGLRRGAKSWL
jgi:hypothetical protein